MLKDLLSSFNPATRSLRTQLALYFIPISILPAVAISFYATRAFEEATRDSLVRRAQSERDAIVAELEGREAEQLAETKRAAHYFPNFPMKDIHHSAFSVALTQIPFSRVRVYSVAGKFLSGKEEKERQIPFLTSEVLQRLRSNGETLDRFTALDGKGFISVARVWIRDRNINLGILETESSFNETALQEMKIRRQVDIALFTRGFKFSGWSLAVAPETLGNSWLKVFQSTLTTEKDQATFLNLGDNRFAGFLYDLPAGKRRNWGYMAVFLPLGGIDSLMLRLKMNLIFITAILIWVFALLIFFFSNRIVKPIELLVLAMKRIKTGQGGEIPPIESTYEIEYLVHAFNEMSRNVTGAKTALESKLNELHRANQEIKNAQTTLVQSAKMISLGQIVAGVAHELNNPIGFIHSNVHHLNDYLARFRRLVEEYRKVRSLLPEKDREQLEKYEAELEIDYILKDMGDLIRSVVDGANRTKEIVAGLRTFSRMEDSTFRKEDIHTGIGSTLKLLSPELKGKVTIHEEFGEIPLVECSLSQLNQVFMNLLSNAAHAIEKKGDIWIRTRLVGDFVVVEIQDNGTGMPQSVIEKIFDPFFSTKKVGEGTGLGLSIAYGLIQKHNGKIRVFSEVGKGTTFIIELPVRQASKQIA